MSQKELQDYRDYKAYLNDRIAAEPKKGHGMRSRLAKAMDSPVSHVSQVLGGKSNLTLEQAEAVNTFLAHRADEADFFLLLVQRARAGTRELQKRLDRQLDALTQKQLSLKDRFEEKSGVSEQEQSTYYGSWVYSAVHILLTIPGYRTREAIAERLGLGLKRVSEILEFLVSSGLATPDGLKFKTGTSRMHLGADSPLIERHHASWRVQSIRSMDHPARAEHLHYSSVVSASRSDFLKIKAMLVREIEAVKAVVRDSPEEELYSFCVDFFEP